MNRAVESVATDKIQGKVIYVLALVIFVQFIFPITESNSPVPLLLYQFFYALLIITGIIIARDNPRLVRLLILFGGFTILGGAIFTFNQSAIWANLIAYIGYIVFQAAVAWLLMRYVFITRAVTRDVIYAAVAIYLLLGAVFVPIYGLIETMTFALSDGTLHAFAGGVAGESAAFAWQDFVYYSYVTLTTLGYGDILPVTMLAKAVVSIEAIIGVMYLTIIMARLVSLYSAELNRDVPDSTESQN